VGGNLLYLPPGPSRAFERPAFIGQLLPHRFNAIQAAIEAIDRALQDERHIANEESHSRS
jgi:hypothetical protein